MRLYRPKSDAIEIPPGSAFSIGHLVRGDWPVFRRTRQFRAFTRLEDMYGDGTVYRFDQPTVGPKTGFTFFSTRKRRLPKRAAAAEFYEDHLRQFHDEIVDAWKKSREISVVRRPREKPVRHTFFAGQRLRRLVREAIERCDGRLPP